MKNLFLGAALTAALAAAGVERVYLDEKGPGSCGPCLFEHRDGGIVCGIKGWYRKSNDGGRTWRKLCPYSKAQGAPTAGGGTNPLRLKDGRLMNVWSESAQNILSNKLGAANFYVSFSSDEGRTWEGKVPLSEDNRRLYLMNDRPIRLSTGRILVSFSIHPNELLNEKLEKVGWVNAFYSDDEGRTWREGQWLKTTVADQLCEPTTFECADGTVKMLARTGVGYLYQTDSRDGGETWCTEYPTTLRSPCAPYFLRRDPYSGWVFIAWDNSFPGPVHQYPRSPLCLGVSRDDGRTWEFICEIENDPMSSYGYPSIFFTKDSILVAYYEQIGFRGFNPKEQRCKLSIFDRASLTVEKVVREPLQPKRISSAAPETWFHIIGGNVSREGLSADIAAIADAGISGIHFFHGGWPQDELWPGVTNGIASMSEDWLELVRFAERECHKRGLMFKMQNCPGWSMSGGPWISPERAMRKIVCFEPGKKPEFDADDDFREIGSVTFPLEASADVSVTFPNPHKICHPRSYEPDAELVLRDGEKEVFRTVCPRGAWQDVEGMTFRVPGISSAGARFSFLAESPHYPTKPLVGSWMGEPRLDMWEAKAGWAYRSFRMSGDARPVRTDGERTLVFGHVNMKRRNGPAPQEVTGWECDKMDPRGFEANFEGYLLPLLRAGVKIDGLLVDSWECGCQTWTWRMEEEFQRRAGYALRPWLPALFGYVIGSEAETEKFLLDWRGVCSRLVEENYYATIARLAREHGMSVQYETAFGDVIPGDLLRYWKYADEPMCEFWSPHDNIDYVGSFDYKPILPCVSAAHVYGKRRVSAESLTSLKLTFNENFRDWKEIVDRHFARGVTHIVFHTYTHNPVVGGKPPSTSFGRGIGSPFLREQTWWPYLRHFSKYMERCGFELERGLPVVDILMYLGDDLGYRPSERELLFENRWKYDYLNNDALVTRLDVRDGWLVLPDGMRYRVLWVPNGTFLKPETEARLAALEKSGARIVRGDFRPDWPSPLEEALGIDAADLRGWYQRRDGGTDVFFVVEKDGSSRFYWVAAGRDVVVFDPVSGRECLRSALPAGMRCDETTGVPLALKPVKDYPVWATSRVYEGTADVPEDAAECILDLGDVRDWATVYVNGRKVADMWCRPYACDIAQCGKGGGIVDVRVEIVSTWYNALVHDAGIPEGDRTTWTLKGPSAEMPYCESGLLGPVRLSATKSYRNARRMLAP